jgi:hypothetical protein
MQPCFTTPGHVAGVRIASLLPSAHALRGAPKPHATSKRALSGGAKTDVWSCRRFHNRRSNDGRLSWRRHRACDGESLRGGPVNRAAACPGCPVPAGEIPALPERRAACAGNIGWRKISRNRSIVQCPVRGFRRQTYSGQQDAIVRLFVTQRHYGIQACCVPRRHIARQKTHRGEEKRYSSQGRGIHWLNFEEQAGH